MNNATNLETEERFLKLFCSNEKSFVLRTRTLERDEATGKLKKAYVAVKRRVELYDVKAHLDGVKYLVLRPELQDHSCKWGAIDHDHYDAKTCAVLRENIELSRLPLYPFESESGGLHTFVFFPDWVPAEKARALQAGFLAQLGEPPDCEIFPKPVAEGKVPYGIAVPFFGDREGFKKFSPQTYDLPLNGNAPASGAPDYLNAFATDKPEGFEEMGPEDVTSFAVALPPGTDFCALLEGKGLKFEVRHEPSGGISYDYHGKRGKDGKPQPCLIQGTVHTANLSNPRCSRFLVKDGCVSHQCFDSDCRGETEPKTRKALEAIGIDFHAESPRAAQSFAQNAIPWPEPLAAKAFHGLAGKIVRVIEPHSEADPAALLVQFLGAFGNIVERGSFFSVEDVEHHGNLFCLIVGETSKSRKGTSWARIERIFQRLEDDEWANLRILGGTSSGEGIIEQVRDANTKEGDGGAPDKRLMLREFEFAQVLAVIRREGNTASEVLRRAWDGTTLQTLTRQKNALRASGAHISLIGHITRTELLRHLDETEVANGLMNRFLICCAKKSKLLPFGGSMSEAEVSPLVRRLAVAVEFAKRDRELHWDEKARPLWAEIYEDLSKDHLGLFGAVIARAEPQVLRLSMLYALLDCSEVIRREHLEAARCVWRYCEDSARHVFGDALGNPVADEILRVLRANPSGMTRTEISDLFGRHRSKSHIGGALSMLVQHGLANFTTENTEGRPVERWRAKQSEKAK